jgi:hypothetical protein
MSSFLKNIFSNTSRKKAIDMKKISTLSDRELLEQVFANQAILLRQLYRINDFLYRKHGDEYVKQAVAFDKMYQKLSEETDDFWKHYHALMGEENEK